MGKQQPKPKFNFTLADSIGGLELSKDPAVQKAQAEQVARASKDTLSSTSITPQTFQFLQYDKDVYDRYLEPGRHGGTPEQLDYQVAQNQSTTKQIVNGLGRLLPLVSTKFAGMINSTGAAIDYAIGNKDAFDETEISSGIKSWEEQIKAAMPVYATEQYDKGSLLEQMGTAKFWADDLGDGVAFLAAQIIGTKGLGSAIGAIGKGASWMGKGVEAGAILNKVPGAAKVANAIANNYTAVTAGLVNAGFSGALQAQDTSFQIKEGLAGKVNPRTNEVYTEEEIKAIAGEKAANTFNATFLVHILPAIWESKIFLGLNKAKLGDIRESIMGAVNRGELKITDILAGTGESALLKNVLKETGKGVAKGSAIEGLWEENVEQSIQNYDIQTGLNDKTVGVGERTLNYAMGMINNLGVKNDAKAVVLGALLGGPMGAFSKYGGAKDFNEKIPAFLNSLRASDALYNQDIGSIYKTQPKDVTGADGSVIAKKGSLILDDEGNPIEDTDKLKNLTFQLLNQKKLWDKQAVATVTGNNDMVTLNENMALSAAVYRELATAAEDGDVAGALDFLKWRVKKQLQEQDEEITKRTESEQAADAAAEVNSDGSPISEIEAEQAATKAKSATAQFNGKERAELTKAINDNMSKLDDFSSAYNLSQVQAKKLVKLGQDKDRMAFNKVAQKGLFYEAVKRQSFDAMVRERQDLLKDPLADVEKIAAEINKIEELRNDSLEKSKSYLNNTDSVYSAWSSPQFRYKTLLEDALTSSENIAKTTDVEKRVIAERKRDTTLYQLNEMEEVEGLGTENSTPTFNEEITQVSPSQRVTKPLGTRNEFFFKAGEDYTISNELNTKIDAYQKGQLSLSNVLSYAKESITALDEETYQRLNGIITEERDKLAAIETQLSETDPLSWAIDEDGEEYSTGANAAYGDLLQQRDDLQANIANASLILEEKQKATEVDMANREPQNIDKFLIKQFALKHFDKGNYVLQNALDANGEVREDYFDRDMINRAIKDLTQMRNALEDRLDSGDLQGVKGLNFLIRDADVMLNQLYKVREAAELNKNNRDGKQFAINKAESKQLISGLGFNLNSMEVINSNLFSAIDETLDGTFNRTLKEISELSNNQYEATMALIHKVQTKGTEGQLGRIIDQLLIVGNTSQAVVKDLLGTKGINSFIVQGFAQNPRQMFPSAWINLSHLNASKGYNRITNDKGTLFNSFSKNNDVDELRSKVSNLPDDTLELGMPKEDFLSLLDAYDLATGAEKSRRLLESPIKPIVQSELKSAEEENIAPTTQQDISIREGVAWLNNNNSGVKPFKGWAFLRGIAGTGKTSVVLKWILNNGGIDKKDVLSTALTTTATDVLAQSSNTQAAPFDQIEQDGIAPNIKLLIIDEYATIGNSRLTAFEEKIRELRKNGQDIKVLMLGDPTQITPRVQNNDDINNVAFNKDAANIRIINPVTVVYRSDVSAVNEVSDLFQDNNKPVEKITVRADKPIGSPLTKGVHTSSSSSQIADIIASNIQEENDTKARPRTRAIIVGNQAEMDKYQGLGADVMTVYDAQSRTYDEVYVDLNVRQFNDIERFNTAMYTAASRAKEYSFLVYPNGENITDSSIAPEYNNNIDSLKESKTAFIQAKTEELAMMDGLDKGQSIKQTSKDKTVQKEVDNAGKSVLDIEVQEAENIEEPEVVADVPSIDEESDVRIYSEMEGDVDPETEQPAAIAQSLPNIAGERQAVDNVDAEAYPALRMQEIGANQGNSVMYLYTSEPTGEQAVNIYAQGRSGNWVKIGKIFQEQINNDPRFEDIKTKLPSTKSFHTNETDVLNGRGSNDIPYTIEQLRQFSVREGRITGSQYLRFIYNNGLQNSQNLAESLSKLFKEKFYYKSQANKADKVIFKIFTDTDLTKGDYDGTFPPMAGIPYAIIGSNGISYKGAMFVRLQPNQINKNDDQIVTLKRLADGVEKIQNITGILMGTQSFNDLVRVFRNSLEIIQEPTIEGTIPKVRAKTDYTHQQMMLDAEALFEKEKRQGDPNLLKGVPDARIQDVMVTIQDVAMQLYGIKKQEGKYTASEIEAMGEEFEAIPTKNKETRKGEEVFYASLKGSTKRDYKKEFRLETANGRAQIAFDQIAKSNEFVGGTRIRVRQYSNRAERKVSYTGKSLINSEGGSSRVYEMITLMASKIATDESKEARNEAIAKVRDMINKSNQDPLLFMSNYLNALNDDAITQQVTRINAKKETPAVNLSTLKLIADDSNFDQGGNHLTSERFPIKRDGETTSQQTYLRKPLQLDKFNELGSDPIANADVLGKMVHTTFGDISPTKISVDFEQAVNSTEEAIPSVNNPETTTTEAFKSTDDQLAVLWEEYNKTTGAVAKMKLMKQIKALNDSKGRMAFDTKAARPEPGKRVNMSKAIADLQRMIPSAMPSDLVFARKAVMAQLAMPGENLLGLFDKGKIYLDTNEDGMVYDNVLRHEVMHKIYNEFLSNNEKKRLRRELDPLNSLNAMEFDELLADTFMSWQVTNITPANLYQRIGDIFNKILNWFGFYFTNHSAVNEIFTNIENGKYSKPIGGSSDVRRGFSNVKTDFGNVANYQQAIKAVHGMVKDAVVTTDLNSSPITMREAKQFVREQLTNKRNNAQMILSENTEILEDLRLSEHGDDAQYIPELEAEISDLSAELGTLNSMLSSDKVFSQLWRDMYPNYKFREGERVSSFEENVDEYTDHDDLTEVQLEDDSNASSLADFTVQSDERNNEGKVTENVKNFLSFIFKSNGTRVNPRYAYLECLRVLNGLVSGEGNLKEQIREAAIYNGIDMNGRSDAKLIVNHLLNLVDNATATSITDINKNTVSLPRNMRFFGEDTFYSTAEGVDLSSLSESELNNRGFNAALIKRNSNESTPAFIARISSRGIDKQQVIGYFKQAQAQETMREVMSNFLSQREASPFIAEEQRIGSMGQTSIVLRYFRAQMHGSERIMATDVENAIKLNWLKIPSTAWDQFAKQKDANDKVSTILSALGINKPAKEMNLSIAADIVANLSAFKVIVDNAYQGGKPQRLAKLGTIGEDGEYDIEEGTEVMDIEFLLGSENSMINNITRMLSKNSADNRASKYQSTDGRSRYLFHNSNQAIETMERVIDHTGKNAKKVAGLPVHLRTSWARFNPFVDGVLNQVHELIDHDGMRREWGEEFAKGYTDESNSDNLQRQFAYSFLSFLKLNATKSDKNLKYVQFFYTISNRPRMIGAQVNVLRSAEISEAAMRMLDQHLAQPDHQNVANYSKYKTINMELLGKAINTVLGSRNATTYANITALQKAEIVKEFKANLKDLASTVADKLISERVVMGDASRVSTLMRERNYLDPSDEVSGPFSPNRDTIGYTKEGILPLVEQWVANNYINGYFLNQLPVGNFNYFKSAIDLVKRMSGVFAPGTKGLIDSEGRFFMKPKFRMAVMNDPKMYSDELSAVFKDNDTALFNEAKNDLSKPNLLGKRTEKGFDLADAQGFMLPSRADNIIAGMGKAYDAGAIFKPAHYEVAERGENGFVPVMMKYSSAVLSDELVEKFPKLRKLREAMELDQIDELVFDSANKVGGPTIERPVPKLNDFQATDFVIPKEAVLVLSNENYRLQLNPKHDTFSDVSNPTQLGYFLNVMGKVNTEAGKINDPAATEVYTAIGNLISHGLKKMTAGLTRSGQVSKAQLAKTLTGAGNERIAEMLKDLSYNMPNIADKALIQIMNMFSKSTVKIKFKGGKFVLQSAYGFEMIKKDSPRYNAMSESQREAHDANWSRYGNKERAKIVEDARSLKYGTDEKGRMFAEVLIDKSYANKAKIGDFLLPDMMGYRIPSTELHSSIAIKVAGFYDSKGSNVIVAPPELVKQHGSDFDVDSLYVIGRELFDKTIPQIDVSKDDPVGYDWDPRIGRWVFNKKNWDDKFPKWYQQAGLDKALTGQIDRLYEMYQRNIIVENFLNVISHPVNIQRMTEPISVQVITDVLENLKLNSENQIDLSNPLDNLEVYNSNFQGAKLVGVFANGMKALAYLLKSGSSTNSSVNYPTLQKIDENGDITSGFTIGETVYDTFQEKLPDGKTIWQVLDALVNTSVDNVKEQQLYKINATNSTGNMYVASQALGIPLEDAVTYMLQPIGLLHSKFGGKLDRVKSELLAAYNTKSEVKVEKYSDLSALSSTIKSVSLQTMKGLINKELESLEEKDILKQVSLMRSFENLYNLGQDISVFSSAVGIVQDFPVMYEDIQKKSDNWDKLGSVNADGGFVTNPDFSFNIDNLFTVQPNIREAYKAFTTAKFTAETSLTKHLPAVRAFVDQIVSESGVKLSFKQNVGDIKNELISYLVSSMYSDENKAEAPYSYTYKNSPRIVTGKQAWSQRFIERLEVLKKENKDAENKNSFLNKIGIQSRFGMKTITFATSSNSDYMDNLEMQEAFEQLPSEEIKNDFVKYAVMNYGLKFGVKNYSLFIPVDYLKAVDEHLKSIDRSLRNNKVNEENIVIEGELANIKENFMLRLAVNNTDKLPFISAADRPGKPGLKPIPTEGKYIIFNTPEGPKQVPAVNGMDEYYYDRKYANPLEDDKRKFKADRFPQFIRTKDNVALMRLNSPDSDFVYYQRLGYKNWEGGYDASKEALAGNYELNKYFGKNIIPVPVGNVNDTSFAINNEYVNVGSKVIVYGNSNESRDQGRIGIVETVNPDLTNPAKRTVTIRDIEEESLTDYQTSFLGRFSPIVASLKTRFNIPINVVQDKEMPIKGMKGMIKDGVAYLNMDKMTWDTPFHEVAHPLIEAIKDKNYVWFNNLVKEFDSSERGKEIMEQVKAAYPELKGEDLKTEGIVTLLGEYAADNLNTEPTLKGLVRRLYRALGDILRSILEKAGVINLDALSRDEMSAVTLNDLSVLLSDKTSDVQLDLSGYIKQGKESRQLDEIEAKLFKEGRIVLTCNS